MSGRTGSARPARPARSGRSTRSARSARSARHGSRDDIEPRAEPPGDPEQELGDPEAVARAICLQQLTSRARSRTELATTLRKRGVPDDAATRVLDRFTEVGLIDDAALAQTLAGAQHRERGLAGRAVALKLRQRGLADEVVGAAVAQIDPDSERARAAALVQKRRAALAGLPLPVQQRRLVGLLARKGYSAALSWEVVGAALRCTDELADQPPDL